MRRNFHQHPIAWPHPDKIHFLTACRVRQNLFAAIQLNFYNRARQQLKYRRLFAFYGLVRTHGPFAVTATQCSK